MKIRAERIEHIRKACQVAEENHAPAYQIKHWKGARLDRKIIRLDSEYLMFRIENSRTEIQQLAYIKNKTLSENPFKDPESCSAQKSQEEILLEMIHTKGKDLLDDLSKHRQEDPCIITYDGFLVNGNRRTAALKELNIRHVECVVLPEDATPKDIYALEQQLQISQDFREDYHWINELRNIRRGREDENLKFSEKELANNLRMEVPELKKKLKMMELVDSFLIWKGIKGQYDYSQLDDAEEIFRQLEKAINKYKKDYSKQENLQNSIFTLIESRPSSGRLYSHVTSLIKNFDQIQARLIESQLDSTEKQTIFDNEIKQPNNLLDELLDNNHAKDVTEFTNSGDAAENSNKLVEVIADVTAENQERSYSEAAYEGISKALRELQGLSIDPNTSKIESVKKKLQQIIQVSESLLKEIESL